jgi:hypothetical protein
MTGPNMRSFSLVRNPPKQSKAKKQDFSLVRNPPKQSKAKKQEKNTIAFPI